MLLLPVHAGPQYVPDRNPVFRMVEVRGEEAALQRIKEGKCRPSCGLRSRELPIEACQTMPNCSRARPIGCKLQRLSRQVARQMEVLLAVLVVNGKRFACLL